MVSIGIILTTVNKMNMKKIWLLLFVSIITLIANAESATFLGIPFAVTPNEFTTSLITKGYMLAVRQDEAYIFAGTYVEEDVTMLALTENNSISAIYLQLESRESWSMVQQDYQRIRTKLTALYGKALDESTEKKGNKRLSSSTWLIGQTIIMLETDEGNYVTAIYAPYSSDDSSRGINNKTTNVVTDIVNTIHHKAYASVIGKVKTLKGDEYIPDACQVTMDEILDFARWLRTNNISEEDRKSMCLLTGRIAFAQALKATDKTAVEDWYNLASILFDAAGKAELDPLRMSCVIELDEQQVVSPTIPSLEKQLKMYDIVLGESVKQRAVLLYKMTSSYLSRYEETQDLSDAEQAENCAHKALDIYARTCPVIDPSDTLTIDILFLLHYRLYDLHMLQYDYQQAANDSYNLLQIVKLMSGEYKDDYASFLLNSVIPLKEMGNYSQAQELLDQVDEMMRENHMENTHSYLEFLFIQGGMYLLSDQQDKAEECFMQELNLARQLYGEKDENYLTALTDFANLYQLQGNVDKTKRVAEEMINILRTLHPEPYRLYVYAYNYLGLYYREKKDYQRSKQYFLKALDNLADATQKEKDLCQLSILDNLGVTYTVLRDYKNASQCFRQTVEICERTYGKQHIRYATVLLNIGFLQCQTREFKKAIATMEQAEGIITGIFGTKDNYRLGMSHLNIGGAYEGLKDYRNALTYYRSSYTKLKKRYIHTLTYMSEQQRNAYWEDNKHLFEGEIQRLAYRYRENEDAKKLVYNNELFVKGLLLNSSEMVKRSIQESGDTLLIEGNEQLVQLKQAIVAMENNGANITLINRYKQQADSLEKELIRNSAVFRQNQQIWEITWDSVRHHLTGEEVAIEFCNAPLKEGPYATIENDSVMYYALLLSSNSSAPQLIPLFEEKEVTSLMQDGINETYSYQRNGRRITSLVWEKIIPYIHPDANVYFSASGLLHRLAVEALPYDSTQTMGDRYHLVRLSSTREIVLGKQADVHTSATLYGGIQYSMNATDMLSESEEYNTSTLLASRGFDRDTLNRGRINYLPGTLTEVKQIDKLLSDNHLNVQVYTSTAANEESFKALSGKKQDILHIATHGFFWSDSTAQQQDYFSDFNMNGKVRRVIDPLSRSGLLLAGANIAYSGHKRDLPEGVQDGILTAKEISLLDLRGADLVVLSACETGSGEVTGEGVFGLQRAFKQAGAQTIIMSLWPVNDQATQMMMTEFYYQWVDRHVSKREAFRLAQQKVKEQYAQPEFWAAFILLD